MLEYVYDYGLWIRKVHLLYLSIFDDFAHSNIFPVCGYPLRRVMTTDTSLLNKLFQMIHIK